MVLNHAGMCFRAVTFGTMPSPRSLEAAAIGIRNRCGTGIVYDGQGYCRFPVNPESLYPLHSIYLLSAGSSRHSETTSPHQSVAD
jgi:hypothetical protein